MLEQVLTMSGNRPALAVAPLRISLHHSAIATGVPSLPLVGDHVPMSTVEVLRRMLLENHPSAGSPFSGRQNAEAVQVLEDSAFHWATTGTMIPTDSMHKFVDDAIAWFDYVRESDEMVLVEELDPSDLSTPAIIGNELIKDCG